MYGNPFSLNYKLYSILATNGTWFKNVWELLHEFKTIATFSADNHIHPVRVGDRSLMQEFSRFFGGWDLQTLNIYRQYKKSIYLSCLVLCDGRTIDKECLTPREGFLTYHKFPLQCPSRSYHPLWVMVIKRISSDYLTLPTTLGEYVRHPHKPFKLITTEDGFIVHLEVILDNVERYLVYMLTSNTNTRPGNKFVRSDRIDHVPLPFSSSITRISNDYIHLHSWTRQYNYSENCTSMFWDKIRNGNNPSLWKNLRCNGDGTWIWGGLCSGSLLIIHDGSYMQEVSPKICSAAVMIRCTASGQTCKCTIAEYSESASSYCGKILGAIITQLILGAAVTGGMGPYPIMTEDCDNNGVVLHGNKHYRPLSASQTQSDVLQVMK
jgi:hypothetical protein